MLLVMVSIFPMISYNHSELIFELNTNRNIADALDSELPGVLFARADPACGAFVF